MADGSPERPAGGETVLLLEDDAEVRGLVRRILVRQGYEVLEAASPEEAFRLAEEAGPRCDLLLTDVILPRMSGRACFEALRDRLPGLRTLYMSGYDAATVAELGVATDDAHFIQKPFTMDEMARKVREILDA